MEIVGKDQYVSSIRIKNWARIFQQFLFQL